MTTTTTKPHPPAASGGPVVIAHAYRWHEAHLAAAMLRAAGIAADVLDPLIHNTMPQNGLAYGGMRLSVPRAQRDEAVTLLAETLMPGTRMSLPKALLFAVLVWWCGAAPMMSGFYLRRPEISQDAAEPSA